MDDGVAMVGISSAWRNCLRVSAGTVALEREASSRSARTFRSGVAFGVERLTQHELEAALRAAGCAAVTDVHFAILENNGQISVRRKDSR